MKIKHPVSEVPPALVAGMAPEDVFVMLGSEKTQTTELYQLLVLCTSEDQADRLMEDLPCVAVLHHDGFAFIRDVRSGRISRVSRTQPVIKLKDVELTYQYPRGV